MTTDRPLNLGTLEKAVLEVLWGSGVPLTVRDVHEEVTMRRPLAYTTIMTVLYRMSSKGLLRQSRDQRAFRYEPVLSPAGFIAEQMLKALENCPPSARRTALLRFVAEIGPHDAQTLRLALEPVAQKTA